MMNFIKFILSILQRILFHYNIPDSLGRCVTRTGSLTGKYMLFNVFTSKNTNYDCRVRVIGHNKGITPQYEKNRDWPYLMNGVDYYLLYPICKLNNKLIRKVN